jgi:hypothetical protein
MRLLNIIVEVECFIVIVERVVEAYEELQRTV